MITWRQTTKYSLASGCGSYRIAKRKCEHGWRYVPFVAEECENAYGKPAKRWFPISKPMRTADEAKEECDKWMQNNEKKKADS